MTSAHTWSPHNLNTQHNQYWRVYPWTHAADHCSSTDIWAMKNPSWAQHINHCPAQRSNHYCCFQRLHSDVFHSLYSVASCEGFNPLLFPEEMILRGFSWLPGTRSGNDRISVPEKWRKQELRSQFTHFYHTLKTKSAGKAACSGVKPGNLFSTFTVGS